MNRLVLVGQNSFIARQIKDAALARGIGVHGVGHDAPLHRVVQPADVVVNCAIAPDYFTQEYDPQIDADLIAAHACRQVDAAFVMLSSRRVYPENARWSATESSPANGDETRYGQNKAHSEKAVRAVLGGKVAILRLSNVFGFEYDAAQTRKTFFARALTSLREIGQICLDMSPKTRRDFLPVEQAAQAIVECAKSGISDTFNLGCGFPVACGDVAKWLIEGYGRGTIIATDRVYDEFYLNVEKWTSHFGPLIEQDALRERCVELGQRLR